jgi:hypothetical protein
VLAKFWEANVETRFDVARSLQLHRQALWFLDSLHHSPDIDEMSSVVYMDPGRKLPVESHNEIKAVSSRMEDDDAVTEEPAPVHEEAEQPTLTAIVDHKKLMDTSIVPKIDLSEVRRLM